MRHPSLDAKIDSSVRLVEGRGEGVVESMTFLVLFVRMANGALRSTLPGEIEAVLK